MGVPGTVSRIAWVLSIEGKEWWPVKLERNRDQRTCVSNAT